MTPSGGLALLKASFAMVVVVPSQPGGQLTLSEADDTTIKHLLQSTSGKGKEAWYKVVGDNGNATGLQNIAKATGTRSGTARGKTVHCLFHPFPIHCRWKVVWFGHFEFPGQPMLWTD
jgi:hypothetical protein